MLHAKLILRETVKDKSSVIVNIDQIQQVQVCVWGGGHKKCLHWQKPTSSGDVGCDEDLLLAITEAVDDGSALRDIEVTGQQGHSMAVLCHLLCKPVGCPPRLQK